VFFQSLVFVPPAGEASAVMLEHHKRRATLPGSLDRPSQWVPISDRWYYRAISIEFVMALPNRSGLARRQ